MIQVCKFDARSDVERTVQGLSLDVNEAMLTHAVTSTASDVSFDNSANPSEIGHYFTDKIQTAIAALRLQKSMSERAAKFTPSPSPSSAAPAEPAVSNP